MSLSARQIDALEDIRIVCQTRCQGPCGVVTARKYANELMHKAMDAFEEGEYTDSVQFCAREFKFNCQVFGMRHPFTRSSLQALKALRRFASSHADQLVIVPFEWSTEHHAWMQHPA